VLLFRLSVANAVDAWPGVVWRVARRTSPRFDAHNLQGEAVLAVSLRRRRLYLYENGALVRSYPVATGGLGARTPRGRFQIGIKLIDPDWFVPDRPARYGSLAGCVVPSGDPRNRLGPRWMTLWGGIGIHGGTSKRKANRTGGCLRMADADLVELFERVPAGAPVLIG
jgi:lipoprotein-anchoring transpeptidase ErfK/SrfK